MVTSNFKLPIEYCEKKQEIVKNIKDDLECNDKKNIYDLLFQSNNVLGKKISLQWNKYYTTNKQFLTQSQKLYKEIKLIKVSNDTVDYYNDFNKFVDMDEIKMMEKEIDANGQVN